MQEKPVKTVIYSKLSQEEYKPQVFVAKKQIKKGSKLSWSDFEIVNLEDLSYPTSYEPPLQVGHWHPQYRQWEAARDIEKNHILRPSDRILHKNEAVTTF